MVKNNKIDKNFNTTEYVQNIMIDEEKRQSIVMKELLVQSQYFKIEI